MHTKKYYNSVNDLLKGAATKEDVIEILNYIAEQLYNGTFMK